MSDSAFDFRLRFAPPAAFLPFLAVEAGGDFFGVALVVQFNQLFEDGAAGELADGVAHALLGFVEAVAQIQIAPVVGGGHGLIHLHMQCAKALDVERLIFGAVETIVGFSKSFVSLEP